MISPLICDTPQAILILALADGGLYRFPFALGKLPGVHLKVQPGQVLAPQLLAALDQYCQNGPRDYAIEIFPDFAVTLALAPQCTLFLGRSTNALLSDFLSQRADCRTMPELLRQMPADKNRVAYLLAWQTLLGVGKEELHALSAEELRTLSSS
jgi:hypothetical protein